VLLLSSQHNGARDVARTVRPVRLDRLLVEKGLASTRSQAKELILQGMVLVDGIVALRPAAQVRADREVRIKSEEATWVGRGAWKLLSVLDVFGVEVQGRLCADFGASTGGFTEVLLQRGAARVFAIDVGRGQLHYRLRTDERVVVMEGVNIRYLEGLPSEQGSTTVDLVVADLSFISLRLILPVVARVLKRGGQALVLVKPQFEAGPRELGKKGRVLHEEVRQRVIVEISDFAKTLGFSVIQGKDSEVAGKRSGNIEHFLHLRRETSTLAELEA